MTSYPIFPFLLDLLPSQSWILGGRNTDFFQFLDHLILKLRTKLKNQKWKAKNNDITDNDLWRRGVVVFTTAQLRFCAGSLTMVPAGNKVIKAFRRSTIPQKKFIIIIIIKNADISKSEWELALTFIVFEEN